jgi:hypothetical protein
VLVLVLASSTSTSQSSLAAASTSTTSTSSTSTTITTAVSSDVTVTFHQASCFQRSDFRVKSVKSRSGVMNDVCRQEPRASYFFGGALAA